MPRLLADEARTLRMILREARLQNAALVLDGLDALDAVPPPLINLLVEVLRPEPGPIYMVIGRRIGPEISSRLLAGLDPSFFTVPTPTRDERLAMWNHALAWNGLDVPESSRLRLAAQALGPESIEQALQVARATRRDVVLVAAEFTRARLSGLATRVPPSLEWVDLVFPERLADELADIAIFARHKTLIADEWGLARSAGGHGIKVLLSGPPGTGKTVVSALLAREAGCELYRVDTSAVVSKWLGETEKHLSELFDVARELGAALLFDEADSLFAKRTEVQTSVDRYANQSVNHLLQLIEDHPGFVVLTTNNDQLLDSAFARRLSFHIKFPSPGQEERALLWRAHLPATVPLGSDVDFEWLALNYELTGGQIRQAAIRAAVAALKQGRRSVGQRDLEVGARAIYASAGRLPPAFKV